MHDNDQKPGAVPLVSMEMPIPTKLLKLVQDQEQRISALEAMVESLATAYSQNTATFTEALVHADNELAVHQRILQDMGLGRFSIPLNLERLPWEEYHLNLALCLHLGVWVQNFLASATVASTEEDDLPEGAVVFGGSL